MDNKTSTVSKTNTRVLALAGAGLAIAAALGFFIVRDRITPIRTPIAIKPGSITTAGYTAPGYTPPGYTAPGYTPPGYTPPGYTPPGYTTPPGDTTPKSAPILTFQNIANNVLSNNLESELYRVLVGAKSSGPIAVKQIAFLVNKTPSVNLSNFRLYRGATMMQPSEYDIINPSDAYSLKNAQLGSQQTNYVVVSFTSEQVIAGSGYVYSLRATASNVLPGNYVSTSLLRIPQQQAAQGFLVNASAPPFNIIGKGIYNIDNSAYGDASAEYPGLFVWSDMSALPHYYTSTDPKSRDWWNDYKDDMPTNAATLSD